MNKDTKAIIDQVDLFGITDMTHPKYYYPTSSIKPSDCKKSIWDYSLKDGKLDVLTAKSKIKDNKRAFYLF